MEKIDKKMDNIIVTTYTNPDLDGAGCSVAYSEFLNKKGQKADAVLFGRINEETQLVCRKFGIRCPKERHELPIGCRIVLVDVSSTFGLSEKIELSRVAELIDHHKLSMGDKIGGAKVQVELVGAAATLIAEMFRDEKVGISPESACLLYYAIISNTINLKNSVTTPRDVEMAGWLRGKFRFEPDYTEELFRKKSEFDRPVSEVLMTELSLNEFGGKKAGITQLEIMDTAEFIRENRGTIRDILKKAKEEKGLDFALATFVDIGTYCNRFVVADKESRVLAERVLGVRFREDAAKREGILMRKEIWPLVKKEMENSKAGRN